jgi:hypothetical protein
MNKLFNKQQFLALFATSLFTVSFYITYNEVSLDVIAQETNQESIQIGSDNNMTSNSQNSNWTGSIEISKVIRESFNPLIKVSLSDAIINAETTIGNDTSAVAGFIHPVKGYLVYVIYLINNQNEVTKVITDVGTGDILNTKKMTIEEMMTNFHHGGMIESDNEHSGQDYMMKQMMGKNDY